METIKNIPNEHPGIILKEEFIDAYNLTAYKLSKATKIPESTLSKIIAGKRAITIPVAARLSKFFTNSIGFWINLQTEYEIRELKENPDPKIEEITPLELA